MAGKRWLDRDFKSRNVMGTGEDQHLPIMYKHRFLWICHYPPDGDVTSITGWTKEEAFIKWKALTEYYESLLE